MEINKKDFDKLIETLHAIAQAITLVALMIFFLTLTQCT